MPEYVVFSLCAAILAAAGILNAPCRAAGLSLFEALYMLLCALVLSVFDVDLSVELKVNAGAAAMVLLPALLIDESDAGEGGAVAALVLFSLVIALFERSGVIYGCSSGLFCGVLAGLSTVLLYENRGCACCVAAGIPVLAEVVNCFMSMVAAGYAGLEIGRDTLFSQFVALGIAITVIWIRGLCSAAEAGAK